MKKKLLAFLVVAGLLVSCGQTSSETPSETPSEVPSEVSSEVPSETPSEVPSEVPSEEPSEDPSSEEELLVVEDPEPTPTYADEEPVLTREFNPLFDTVLDDFSGEVPTGTLAGEAEYLGRPYLLAPAQNKGLAEEDKSGHTPDNALYKVATGIYPIHEYDISFTLRLVAGSLSLDDLYLGLRGDDAWKVHAIPFSELNDDMLEPLPALAEEFQEYTISLTNSIFDDTITYELNGGGDSGTRILEQILGLHLMVDGESDAKIAIQEIKLVKVGIETMFDDFNRADVNAGDPNVWWRGSNGQIVPRHVELKEDGSYTVENAEAATDKENLAITLRGDFSDLSLVPLTDGVAGTPIAWSSLVDPEGNALINSTHNYETVVIDLVDSGVPAGTTGFRFESTSRVFIKGLFFSNLETKEAAKQWPYVDIANGVVFDDFNGRVQSNFGGDYEAAIADQVTIDAGLLYILSYSNGNLVRIENDVMTLDATSFTGNEYINVKIGAGPAHANPGKDYLVLAVKGEDGATLDGLRISGTGTSQIFFNNWKAAFGLPVPDLDDLGNYPYVDDNGFAYLVVDLAETGFDFADVIDIYYSGTGKLLIDSISFADKVAPFDLAAATAVGDPSNEITLGEGYKYVYGGNLGGAPYYALTFTGDGTVDLSSIRLGDGVTDAWFKDGVIIDAAGNAVTDLTLTADEPRQIIIDLAASGLSSGDIHIHAGDTGEEAGTLIIGEKLAVPSARFSRVVDEAEHTVVIGEGYAYGFGFDITNPARYLELTVVGDGTAGLGTMRIEAAGNTIYANSLVLDNGETLGDFVPSTEGDTIVIDLIASGYDFFALPGGAHFHFGDAGATAGTVTFNKVAFADYSPASYVDLLPLVTL